jgi:hypothetical protein
VALIFSDVALLQRKIYPEFPSSVLSTYPKLEMSENIVLVDIWNLEYKGTLFRNVGIRFYIDAVSIPEDQKPLGIRILASGRIYQIFN